MASLLADIKKASEVTSASMLPNWFACYLQVSMLALVVVNCAVIVVLPSEQLYLHI